MLKNILLVLIITLTFSKVYAQKDSSTRNNIIISTSINQGYFKDLNFSPLNYSSSGIYYGLSYSRITPKSVFLASLDFNNNSAKTSQQTGFPESEYLQGKLKIAYLKKINHAPNKYNIYLGGQYQSNINYIDFLEESTTFLVAHSLDISFYGEYDFNKKHSITSSISLPLFVFMVRSPFSGFDEELEENQDKPFRLITNGDFISINKYISPSFSVKYEYNISKLFSVFGKYQVSYQKLINRDTFIAFQNQFQIGVKYKF